MRALSHLGYWLAWLLFRPLLALVKFRVAPGDLHEQLDPFYSNIGRP